jgi:hypothetical protein
VIDSEPSQHAAANGWRYANELLCCCTRHPLAFPVNIVAAIHAVKYA